MTVRAYRVLPCTRKEIQPFIEQWHYSGSINGCISDYCFALYDNETLIGGMFYGRMAMAGQYKRFSDNQEEVTELRRLCCIDDTPKNTESYFIGSTLRWLKKNTKIKTVVSYADAEYNHSGVIYKASNFKLEGFRKGAKVIIWNGKKYHDKSLRTKYKGELKPFALRLKEALEKGEAHYSMTAGKFCYVYELKNKGK
jgi:hypothetical protein